MDRLNYKKIIFLSLPIVFAVALAIILAACMAQAGKSLDDSLLEVPSSSSSEIGITLPTKSDSGFAYRDLGNGTCEVTGIVGKLGESISIPKESPDGMKVVGIADSAFLGMSATKSISLPDGLVYIGAYAFYGSSLVEATVPSSVTEIGECAFAGCTSLLSVNVSSGNQNYCSMDGVLFSKDKSELICYPAAKTNSSYTLRSGIVKIHKMAFYGCTSLTNLNFNGTEDEWALISIGAGNELLTSVPIKFPSSDK